MALEAASPPSFQPPKAATSTVRVEPVTAGVGRASQRRIPMASPYRRRRGLAPTVPDMANESLSVIECTTVDDELLAAMQRLVPQLSSSSPPPDRTRLTEIVESPACHLLLARDGSAVLGSMTLVVFPIPTGIRAWIEDVVVDSDARGRGVGEALNRRAIEIALERGARTVDLTSRPKREAANRLYKRLGFVERDTNVYRLVPEAPQGD